MIYLDNAASAPVLDCALSAAEPFLRDCWGNPSSIHTEGRRAALALIEAREKCAGRSARLLRRSCSPPAARNPTTWR